jgi:hypothetical protein
MWIIAFGKLIVGPHSQTRCQSKLDTEGRDLGRHQSLPMQMPSVQ